MHQFKHYYNHLHNFQSNCIQSAHTKVYEGQIMSWWDTCSSSLHSTWCRAAMFVYGNPRGMNFLRSWQQESFINEVVLFTNKVNMVHNWNIKQIYQKIKTKSRSSPPPFTSIHVFLDTSSNFPCPLSWIPALVNIFNICIIGKGFGPHNQVYFEKNHQ